MSMSWPVATWNNAALSARTSHRLARATQHNKSSRFGCAIEFVLGRTCTADFMRNRTKLRRCSHIRVPEHSLKWWPQIKRPQNNKNIYIKIASLQLTSHPKLRTEPYNCDSRCGWYTRNSFWFAHSSAEVDHKISHWRREVFIVFKSNGIHFQQK